MLRTSTFLAIALSATAIVSVTIPAAAFPRFWRRQLRIVAQITRAGNHQHAIEPGSQPCSGKRRRPAQARPRPGPGIVEGSNAEQPIPVLTKISNAEQPIPKSHLVDSVQNAHIPQQNLYLRGASDREFLP